MTMRRLPVLDLALESGGEDRAMFLADVREAARVIAAGAATLRPRPPRSDLVGKRVQLPIDGSTHLRQGPIVEDAGD